MSWNIGKRGLLLLVIGLCASGGYAYLNGPIVDAYQAPFLYVYGTGSPNQYENDVIAKTTQDVVDKWKLLRERIVPIKKDVQVTDEDVKNFNLILYGNERSNKFWQKIAKDLPIRITDEAIIVGDRKYSTYDEGAIFVAPNPLNPNKYVLIYGALTYHGFPHMNAVQASATDFVIFNTATKNIRLGEPPSSPLEEGYFDKTNPLRWKVKPLPKTPVRIIEETSYQPVQSLKTPVKKTPTKK